MIEAETAHLLVIFQSVPDVEKESGELFLRYRETIDPYPLPYGNHVRRSVEAWMHHVNAVPRRRVRYECAPTFQCGIERRIIESVNADVEPFPLVPVMWITLSRLRSLGYKLVGIDNVRVRAHSQNSQFSVDILSSLE